MSLRLKLKTAIRLGVPNLSRVAWYRVGIRFGLNPVKRLTANIIPGPFFNLPAVSKNLHLDANRQWNKSHCFFGWCLKKSTACPNWTINPFNGRKVKNPLRPWWMIPDFDPELGDIKTVWEPSRFEWVLGFAQQATQGDRQSIIKLNDWIADWVDNNPPYHGANWKCGQEVAIRVMHLAMAALILDQADQPEQGLISLIESKIKRIAPTISYAIAQDNNHGSSEAAALFIGGSWLEHCGKKMGRHWKRLGRKWLENRAARLIAHDGSFSQYSTNYHRVMLDTYSMAEIWRRNSGLPKFNEMLYSRLRKATYWLYRFIQPGGDVPNLGANDGARLLPLTTTDFRDYRASVQLAMALFDAKSAFPGNGKYNTPLRWLDIAPPTDKARPSGSCHMPSGGYFILRKNGWFALLRYPNFLFRPKHCDCMHVDLWHNGKNLLFDSGSYSYNTVPELMYYFSSTKSHNTVQFDDREQMPRVGRFLLGNWLKADMVDPIKEQGNELKCGARYTDSEGAAHYRGLNLSPLGLRVEDKVTGFSSKAVLRWRLPPGDWRVAVDTVSNDRYSLRVSADTDIKRFELVDGFESRYYLKKKIIPVLEVEICRPGTLISEFWA